MEVYTLEEVLDEVRNDIKNNESKKFEVVKIMNEIHKKSNSNTPLITRMIKEVLK